MASKSTGSRGPKLPKKPSNNKDDEEVRQSGSATDDERSDFSDNAEINESRPHELDHHEEVSNDMTDDDDIEEDENRVVSAKSANNRPIKNKYSKGSNRKTPLSASFFPKSTPHRSNTAIGSVLLLIATAIAVYKALPQQPISNSKEIDWRSKVDPHDALSQHQQSIVRASMKAIMDKYSSQEGVSTLLILSPDEESAAKLARCLLGLVNTATHKAAIPTEVDLQSHRGGKVQLDANLRTLLSPGDTIRAVLLRHIDDQTSTDAFERARLLFAYCDGENPVVPHRLIIMTATSTGGSEDELRETFKTRWPKEHDFVDALMSRISGHTLFVNKEQTSIC